VFFEYPFQLPPYYALIIRSLSFLEGLAIQTDPEYKLLAASYPYMAQRLLTDRSPELRSSLEELILQKGRIRWGRFESLLTEGVKSKGFSSDGLWRLADWLVSDSGKNVRKPAAKELISLADGAVMNTMRRNIGFVAPNLVDRVAPLMTPADVDVVERAERLFNLVGVQPSLDPASVQQLVSRAVANSLREAPDLQTQAAAAAGASAATGDAKATKKKTTGNALSFPMNADDNTILQMAIREPLSSSVHVLRQMIKGARTSSERIEMLLTEPGGRELVDTVVDGLVQRGLARSARTLLGLTGNNSLVSNGNSVQEEKNGEEKGN